MRLGRPRNEPPARPPGPDGAPIVPPSRTQLTQLLYAGIDGATKTHAVGVVDDHGGIRARFHVATTGKGLGGLIRRLVKLQVAGVAIERPDGPLVEAMGDAGLRVVVITPRQVKALPSRYRAAGAKSDAADALLLADGLGTDGHRLASLCPDSHATQVLGALSPTPKDLQKARVALGNQLTAQLERCFPGAVGLFADLHSATAIALLGRYPTGQAAAGLTQARLAAFERRIHSSGRTPVAVLLARLQTAPPANLSPDQAADRAVWVTALGEAIPAGHGRKRELEAEIIQRLQAHADQAVLTSLPKAGRGIRAAALLSELGDVRTRFPDQHALAGLAPVTRASGKLRPVGFRWAGDNKLRAAVIDFADDSRHGSPWAAKVDAQALARTRRHPQAVPILARAWIRVIWRIWQDHTSYDPAKHPGTIRLLTTQG